jgi:hypothetical protein
MAEKTAEEIRDEKCFPVTQAILEGMAKNLLEEDGVKNTAVATLSLLLEQDLNVTTDVSYIPQLILGALSGVNATVQVCDMAPLDEEKYNNVAKKILGILADTKIKIGFNPDEVSTVFAGIKDKLSALFLEEKLNSLEVKHIMDNILSAFNAFNNMLASSIEMSSEKATAKLFELDVTSDLTMKKLDEVLKK